MADMDETTRVILDPHERLRRFTQKASDFPRSDDKPLKMYMRSAQMLFTQAKVYEDENDFQTAYYYYTRLVTLWVEWIRTQPNFNTLGHAERSTVRKMVEVAMNTAEKLKVLVLKGFEKEAEEFRKELESQRQMQLKLEQEERQLEEAESKPIPKPRRSATGFAAPTESLPPAVSLNADAVSYPAEFFHDATPTYPPTEPTVDRSLKPRSLDLTNGLRTVVIPSVVTTLFLKVAEANTLANVETCGYLCGKLAQNRFLVTHLLIPKQSGTADSCAASDELEMFAYQDENDLMTLGWIHTHPSQTAFLSSVDMHNQCSYQLLFHETVAVVCAPKFDEVGVFTLSSEVGMKEIGDCRLQGFHPHRTSEPYLFERCQHAQLVDGYSCQLIDLR